MMTRDHIAILLIFIVVIIGSVVSKIIYDVDKSKALQDAVIVRAQVESVLQTRGPAYVHVKYEFNGKTFHEDYDSYDREALDSLKQYKTVRLLISKSAPGKYIKYLGIEIL